MKGGKLAAVAVGLLLVVLVVASLARTQPPQAYDPRSAAPDGAKALVLLLGTYGATVEITGTIPSAGDDTGVLVLVDRLTRTQHEELTAWAAAGGSLVVADPSSELHEADEGEERTQVFGLLERGRCTLTGVERLRTLSVGAGVSYELRAGDTGCFGDSRRSFVRTTPRGRGEIVAIGSPELFTNALLDEADNAALAVDLLASANAKVVVVEPRLAGDGDEDLLDLVSPRVWQALVQLVIAFVVLGLWRGRRLGKPVVEPAPVEIPGSELVLARGSLMQRAHQPGLAADSLRSDLHRELCLALSLPSSTPVEVLDAASASRAGAEPGAVVSVLAGPPVSDEAALAELSRSIDRLRADLTIAAR
ncbi:MAG TPA: DUF4350 domain-containing protein [Acidimicrobiales bacterium]